MHLTGRCTGWLFLLVISAALALPPTAQLCTAEDYAITAAGLSDLFAKQKPPTVLLLGRTSTGFPPGMAGMTQFGEKVQSLFKDIPRQVKDDFESRNKSHVKLEADKIKTPFAVVLLRAEEAAKLVEGHGSWETFHKKYPKAPGITLVSRPGLNAERTRALLYVGTSCDMLCGEGVFMLLGKDGNAWKLLNKVTIWVS